MLPDGRVALLTNSGLLLVHAPGFAQLDGAAEIGGLVPTRLARTDATAHCSEQGDFSAVLAAVSADAWWQALCGSVLDTL